MQALGLIETRGLLAAIECADVMLKTAKVELVERTFVGGGLVTIVVTGDVGAVKAAVESGVSAVEKISQMSLISQHVIPRPHHDIEGLIAQHANSAKRQLNSALHQENEVLLLSGKSAININEPLPNQDTEIEWAETFAAAKESNITVQIALENFHKEEVDAFVREFGIEKCVNALQSLSVVKLRNLARTYKEIDIVGRAISKANKDLLIQKLKGYYERGSEQ